MIVLSKEAPCLRLMNIWKHLNQHYCNTRRITKSYLMDFFSVPDFKMVFVVNMDLEMGRGKQCAQVAHAALSLYLQIIYSNDFDEMTRVQQWITSGQKKIVLRGENLEQMLRLKQEAIDAKLPNHLVTDAGHTQIDPGSKTVLSLFGTNEQLDRITGTLRLL